MKNLFLYLKIIDKEIDYHKRVYKGRSKRYRDLIRQREILEFMIFLSKNS